MLNILSKYCLVKNSYTLDSIAMEDFSCLIQISHISNPQI